MGYWALGCPDYPWLPRDFILLTPSSFSKLSTASHLINIQVKTWTNEAQVHFSDLGCTIANKTCLSRCGFPSEEFMIEWTVGWVEIGLQENTPIGDCFQRGRAFVRETKPNEELQKANGEISVILRNHRLSCHFLFYYSTLIFALVFRTCRCCKGALEKQTLLIDHPIFSGGGQNLMLFTSTRS